MHHGEFNDPRLVEVYDAECLWSRDDELFLALVNEQSCARAVDLGCGTGRLTLALAAAGHIVTGVDPALPSLEAAKGKPGAEAVTWVLGTSSILPTEAFDVALMTSHVAQFFVSDDDWQEALGHLARTLVPGGRLLFDSRDPEARVWERWNRVDSQRRTLLADSRTVSTWTEVTGITANDVVSVALHYEFPDGLQLVSTATLRFRTEAELRSSLAQAGFAISAIYGGWERQPVGSGDGEFIVNAHV